MGFIVSCVVHYWWYGRIVDGDGGGVGRRRWIQTSLLHAK